MEVKVKKKPSPIRSPAKKATTTKPKTKAAVKCFASPNKQPDTPGSPIPGPSSASTPIKKPKEKKNLSPEEQYVKYQMVGKFIHELELHGINKALRQHQT